MDLMVTWTYMYLCKQWSKQQRSALKISAVNSQSRQLWLGSLGNCIELIIRIFEEED